MSRSIADYLVQENNYEDEYKRNFSDYLSSDSESTTSVPDDFVNDLRLKNMRKKKVEKLYTEFITEAHSLGLLAKVNFFHFCNLIKEVELLES
jgi:hypothetical protein